MNIHEYQAKEIFAKYSVPTPRGIVANTPAQAVAAAHELGGDIWVVKAQIHAGGRGLGGGVKVAKSIEEVEKLASEILHMQLVTHQTGPEGKKVNNESKRNQSKFGFPRIRSYILCIIKWIWTTNILLK